MHISHTVPAESFSVPVMFKSSVHVLKIKIITSAIINACGLISFRDSSFEIWRRRGGRGVGGNSENEQKCNKKTICKKWFWKKMSEYNKQTNTQTNKQSQGQKHFENEPFIFHNLYICSDITNIISVKVLHIIKSNSQRCSTCGNKTQMTILKIIKYCENFFSLKQSICYINKQHYIQHNQTTQASIQTHVQTQYIQEMPSIYYIYDSAYCMTTTSDVLHMVYFDFFPLNILSLPLALAEF